MLLQHCFKVSGSTTSASDIAAVSAAQLKDALSRDQAVDEAERDPVFQNTVAAEYVRAGHEFETRRDSKSLDRALECFDKAIAAQPSSALARSYFAMAAVTRFYSAQASPGLLLKANRLGREAVRLNPVLPEAHRGLGGLLYAEGNLIASREQSLEAIELGGPSEGPVVAVANIAKVLGRPDLSLRWHELAKAIQEHPSDYEFSMADCWADLGEDEKAEEIYQRVSALHPDLPESWVGICRLRLLEGHFEAAREIYRKAIPAFADFPIASQMAAEVEFFSRNWPEAEERYRKLAETDPEGGAAFYGSVTNQSALAYLSKMRGVRQEGEAILEQIVKLSTEAAQRAPNNPEILYRLAAVEASLNRDRDAISHLRRAFECGWLDYRSLRLDPRFDTLRTEQDFNHICDAMATKVAALRAAQVTQNKIQ